MYQARVVSIMNASKREVLYSSDRCDTAATVVEYSHTGDGILLCVFCHVPFGALWRPVVSTQCGGRRVFPCVQWRAGLRVSLSARRPWRAELEKAFEGLVARLFGPVHRP